LCPNGRPEEMGMVVKAREDRFQAPIKAFGTSPNLVKLSAKDTNGQLAAFEYEGLAKMGPPLPLHLNQDETFYVLEGDCLFQVGKKSIP